jgi:threonine dehydrogenase-like Zn-dependent dehydrogenase
MTNAAGVPETMSALLLYGAGMEQLRLERAPVPRPGPGEYLVQVDAVGVCASDYKMVAQGEAHTRVRGRDLAADPTTPGHEVSFTVVAAGPGMDAARVGRRFTLQPNIVYRGVPMAYGYRLAGGLRQYHLIGPEVLEGDYLLDIDPSLSHAQVALAEPWACVYFAYENHRPSKSVKPGGVTWTIGAGPLGLMHVEKAIAAGAARVVLTELRAERLGKVRQTLAPLARRRGVRLDLVNPAETRLADLFKPASVDDVILACPSTRALAEALPYVAQGGFINCFAGFPSREQADFTINLNDMHYGNWTVVASSGSPIECLRRALDDVAAGRIDPHHAVAAVGGIDAAWQAIAEVHAGTYPGKIVIYPQVECALTPVEDLTGGRPWSREAERRLYASS